MQTVGTVRLYILRALYLLLAVGLGLSIGPSIVFPSEPSTDAKTVVRALLGAVGLLALLGLRYPLRMIPLLLFELVWKSIWLIAFAFPAWRSGHLDVNGTQNAVECLVGIVLVLVAVPWPYAIERYIRERGDPRRNGVGDRSD